MRLQAKRAYIRAMVHRAAEAMEAEAVNITNGDGDDATCPECMQEDGGGREDEGDCEDEGEHTGGSRDIGGSGRVHRARGPVPRPVSCVSCSARSRTL